MLISGVGEVAGEGRGEPAAARRWRGAGRLRLTGQDHDFESGDDPLTTRDLVLLYKNIDLGKQLMSDDYEMKRRAPNQYVENVIYHDDAETDSDLSETFSGEDLHSVMMLNKERIDLLTEPSLNALCHKLGDLEIQVSNISTHYGRSFLFKDPYIKEQLKLLTESKELDAGAPPASLLDYVCCKRLEDNYNFYMDNIIRYVKHTIQQLKCISNGDYLPDRVREKWRELERDHSADDASKVLAMAVSIPPRAERARLAPAWDDIVHSEVDLRSLVKILEKKIVVEIPKMISGSYVLFSKHSADSAVVRCARRRRPDLVLRRRASADVRSLIILQPPDQRAEGADSAVLPWSCEVDELPPKVVELPEPDQNSEETTNYLEIDECDSQSQVVNIHLTGYKENDDDKSGAPGAGGETARAQAPAARVVRAEAAADHATPNHLQFSIRDLDRQTSLPEEGSLEPFYTSERKKSPVKIRIKSPYENKSAVIEERKRRKLLEVRERRERKKMALSDNSKITKHRPSPQAVNSVTKLSITNKAFYNSIYGRNGNCENDNRIFTAAFKQMNGSKGAAKRHGAAHGTLQEEGEGADASAEFEDAPHTCRNINKSHFLDDAETEMAYLERKLDDCFPLSTPTSPASRDSLPRHASPARAFAASLRDAGHHSTASLEKTRSDNDFQKPNTQCTANEVLRNSPELRNGNNEAATAVACRRSIEKIYSLMQKLHQIESNDATGKRGPGVSAEGRGPPPGESGTSLCHRSSFTNPSYATFDKPADLDDFEEINKDGDDGDPPSSMVRKVVISTKAEVKDVTKRDHKKVLRVRTIPENPLKAISQLLHEFDNVQKCRQKIADPKTINRSMATEPRHVSRQEPLKRRSRIDSPVKEEPLIKVGAKGRTRFAVRDDLRPEDGKCHVPERRRISDLVDEAREALGEAVRGPPRLSSRLDALAQPRRAHVQPRPGDLLKRQVVSAISGAGAAAAARSPPRLSRLARLARLPRAPALLSAERAAARTSSARRRAAPRAPPRDPPCAPAAPPHLHPPSPTLGMRPAPEAARPGARVRPARAPLLPADLELIPGTLTPETGTSDTARSYSGSLGVELHRMVAAMLLAERPERCERPGCGALVAGSASETPTAPSFSLDDNDILIDQISTAFDDIDREKSSEDVERVATKSSSLETLELHREPSSQTFPGRFRLLKLAPEPLLHCVAPPRAGGSSLVLRNGLSQKKRFPKSTAQKTDLMALLSTTRLPGGLGGIPLQILTVGYVFPFLYGETNKVAPKMSKDLSLGTRRVEFPATTMLEITDGRDQTTRRCVMTETELCEVECGVQTCCPARLCAAASLLEDTLTTTRNVETSTSEGSVAARSSDNTVKRNDNDDIKSNIFEENHELSEYTKSLDMLVGLLNEIQKITTCTDDVVSAQSVENESKQPSPLRTLAIVAQNEGIQNAHDGSLSLVPDAHNDNQTEMLVPVTKSVSSETTECKPLCKDKEVLADVPETPRRHAAANTASPPCPRAGAAPAGAQAGVAREFIEHSSCSTTHSDLGESDSSTSVESGEKITEYPETNRNSVKSLVPFYDNIFKVDNIKRNLSSSSDNSSRNIHRNSSNTPKILVNIVHSQKSKVMDEIKVQNKNIKKEVIKCFNPVDVDYTLKMKRDILVTFYSILVLTVFAALAFPEVLQQA